MSSRPTWPTEKDPVQFKKKRGGGLLPSLQKVPFLGHKRHLWLQEPSRWNLCPQQAPTCLAFWFWEHSSSQGDAFLPQAINQILIKLQPKSWNIPHLI